MLISKLFIERTALAALKANAGPGQEPKLQGWSLDIPSEGLVKVRAFGEVWAAVPYRGGKWVAVRGERAILPSATPFGEEPREA